LDPVLTHGDLVPSEISAYLPLITSISPRHKSIIPALELTLEYLKRHSRIGDMLIGVVLRSLLHDIPTKKHISFRHQNKSTKTIMFLKQFIEQHYNEQMDYNKFIALTRLSRGYLCQAFKKLTGHSPSVYLNHIRLEHARRLLTDPCMNIAEVGRTVGIPNANYFARLFRKYIGMSPTEAMIDPAWPIRPSKKLGTHGNNAGRFG
jgi:AraC-like DNA-binding protein